MEHSFEFAWSTEKPSSEKHSWSYQKACEACLGEVEKRHGVDWKITDVSYDDLGRETHTDGGRWGHPRKWSCTHKVRIHYNVVRRGPDDDSFVGTGERELSLTR